MAEAILNQPQFQEVEAARTYLENLRWLNGAVCPHCGVVGNAKRLQGIAHRPGLWKCTDCRSQFSVTVGTVFEDSKVPLNKWPMAVHLMCSSKKGISAKQLERILGVSYKTAWFMAHRIREAMTSGNTSLLGGGGTDALPDFDQVLSWMLATPPPKGLPPLKTRAGKRRPKPSQN